MDGPLECFSATSVPVIAVLKATRRIFRRCAFNMRILLPGNVMRNTTRFWPRSLHIGNTNWPELYLGLNYQPIARDLSAECLAVRIFRFWFPGNCKSDWHNWARVKAPLCSWFYWLPLT